MCVLQIMTLAILAFTLTVTGANTIQELQEYDANAANMTDVHFLLWTRNNPGDDQSYEMILDDVENLLASPFDSKRPTIFLVHGWTGNGHEPGTFTVDSKTELLIYSDYNVIGIDWYKIAAHIDYFISANDVPKVGAHAAKFLDFLHTEGGLDISQTHVIGISLGAHVTGVLGSHVMNGPLGRITGLDPAGPEFYTAPEDFRLESSDAMFVDIIHSNSGPLLDFCVGLDGAYGHVDFYPNGGHHQNGCTIGGHWEELLTAGCSHKRSGKYWTESINGATPFTSRPCPDLESYQSGLCEDCGAGCLNMGFHLDKNSRGTYYLETKSLPPYAKG